MMEPCVVVVNSCAAVKPDDVIKQILGVEELPEPLRVLPEVRGYSWHVDTKYYEADIQVCALERKSIGTQEFADAVNAVVLPFDSSRVDGLDVASQWLTFIEELDPEVKILLCRCCAPDDNLVSASYLTSKLQAQNWCVKNGFELVESEPVVLEDDEDFEDDFPETTGIQRIVQALHAHVWPNLVMKRDGCRPTIPIPGLHHALNGLSSGVETQNRPEFKNHGGPHSVCTDTRAKLVAEVKPLPKEAFVKPSNIAIVSPMVSPTNVDVDQDISDEPQGLPVPTATASTSTQTAGASADPNARPSPTKDERLEAMFKAMEAMPEETFEELFKNLNDMKSEAERLSPTQRKAYAERIAVTFWKSMGGNDSEVEGVSSDDD